MGTRYTVTDARRAVERLRMTMGRPAVVWQPRDGGGNQCNVGAIELHVGNATCGIAWAVHETMNDSGGVREIIRAQSAADLVMRIDAFCEGYYRAKRDSESHAVTMLRHVMAAASAHNWRCNSDEADALGNARRFLAGVQS